MSRGHALVTGASAGVGQALAAGLREAGWVVSAGARRVDMLEGDFTGALDVTDPRSVEAFFAAAEEALGALDAVVVNAGMAVPGRLHEVTSDEIRAVLDTNLLGALYTARAAVASMLAHGTAGDVVFVSSDSVEHAVPHLIAYSASKAGLEQAARSLRAELSGTGIRVSVLRCGPMASEFGSGWDPGRAKALMKEWTARGLFADLAVMQPAEVARALVHALESPRDIEIRDVHVSPRAPLREAQQETPQNSREQR